MGEVTLEVPAQHVESLRVNVYTCLAGEGDALDAMATPLAFPTGSSADKLGITGPPSEDEKAAELADKAREHARNIGRFSELLSQLGWRDPINGREYQLNGERRHVVRILESAITDVGDRINGVTEDRPFDRAGFDRAMEDGRWIADRLTEFEVEAS